jgi:hypothetical protein
LFYERTDAPRDPQLVEQIAAQRRDLEAEQQQQQQQQERDTQADPEVAPVTRMSVSSTGSGSALMAGLLARANSAVEAGTDKFGDRMPASIVQAVTESNICFMHQVRRGCGCLLLGVFCLFSLGSSPFSFFM